MYDCRQKFEMEFLKLVKAKKAYAFSLGRQALAALLKAADIKQGDHVGVCAFTCPSVIEAVMVLGAVPVFLDVDKHLCIDPEQIRLLDPGLLKVVILQHTFGNPGQLEELLQSCKKKGIKVIEDCAHALGCFWGGEPLGSFGLGAIYSFQWGKPFTIGQGGMLIVNSPELVSLLDQIDEEFALPSSIKLELVLELERWAYFSFEMLGLRESLLNLSKFLRDRFFSKDRHQAIDDLWLYRGYIRRAGPFTSLSGVHQVRRWPRMKAIRKESAKIIEKTLSEAGLATWPRESLAEITFLRYPLLVKNKKKLIDSVFGKKLGLSGWYDNIVHSWRYETLEKVGYHAGQCRMAESMIPKLVHLPTNVKYDHARIKWLKQLLFLLD